MNKFFYSSTKYLSINYRILKKNAKQFMYFDKNNNKWEISVLRKDMASKRLLIEIFEYE